MNLNSDWHAVLRLVWLTGGLVAINEPGPDVQIKAGVNGKVIDTFQIGTYGGLFEALRSKGFLIIGTTFAIDQRELELLWRPEFRAMNPRKSWLIWDMKQQWREIAVTTSNSDMALMDIASRLYRRA